MGMEITPGRRARRRGYWARQERRWAAKAGPVTVRRLEASRPPPEPDPPTS